AFALIQLSTSIHHFDNEGFCIQSTEARILDLSSDKANVTAYNTPLHNWTACSVIGADFNHDGIEDFTTAPSCGLILTEPVVQVVYGSNQLEDKIQLDGAEPANITIDIKLEDEVFSLGHTDIDKNGIADLLIGTSTRSLIFYGKEINIPTILLTEDDADIIIYELQLSRHRGIIVSGGDVNGDNFGDIILGVPNVNFSNRLYAGVVHVVYGNNFPHGTIIDIAIEKADITIYGEKENDKLGNDVAIGDINQDGFVDIIIGARKAAGGKGKAYIIYGRRNFPPKHVIDLATEEADITIIGESMDDEFGNSVFGADVNGDGIDDIIIGAMRADASGREKSGKVYVIYGREDFTPKEIIDLSSRAADLTILGQDANFRLGSTVSSGDINADTIGDLLVGSSTPTQAISYVLYGRRDFESNTVIDLATIQANITVYYDDYWLPTVDFDNIVLAQISEPMALAAGDVNGDFVDDLLIGNPFSKPYVLGAGFGTAYVIYGEGCPCNGLLEIKPGQNQGELKHGCSPGTWKIGEKEIGWNQG
ncbi:FG-GAP repeat protein, partial [Candidatus Woesearchaeota archaeon]|nr:FG-GAP repeat protein [Candidatus Woesearchaeota archaeon]